MPTNPPIHFFLPPSAKSAFADFIKNGYALPALPVKQDIKEYMHAESDEPCSVLDS